MSKSQIQNLVSMLHQIVDNNSYKKTDEETATIVVNHLNKFWAPSMREKIVEYAATDEAELSEAAKLAVAKL